MENIKLTFKSIGQNDVVFSGRNYGTANVYKCRIQVGNKWMYYKYQDSIKNTAEGEVPTENGILTDAFLTADTYDNHPSFKMFEKEYFDAKTDSCEDFIALYKLCKRVANALKRVFGDEYKGTKEGLLKYE